MVMCGNYSFNSKQHLHAYNNKRILTAQMQHIQKIQKKLHFRANNRFKIRKLEVPEIKKNSKRLTADVYLDGPITAWCSKTAVNVCT